MGKTYITVDMTCGADGNIVPLVIHWADGTRYTVDKVVSCCEAASTRAGGYGTRYTVRISCEELGIYGKTRYLFYEKGLKPERWFVETKEAPINPVA